MSQLSALCLFYVPCWKPAAFQCCGVFQRQLYQRAFGTVGRHRLEGSQSETCYCTTVNFFWENCVTWKSTYIKNLYAGMFCNVFAPSPPNLSLGNHVQACISMQGVSEVQLQYCFSRWSSLASQAERCASRVGTGSRICMLISNLEITR